MELLQPLNLPPFPFKISDNNGQLSLFDIIRKKNIVITPEEWVRQHFVQFLIQQKHYPKGLIKLEGGHRFNGMQKRSDILVFNKAGDKILLVECKAPSISVDQKTFGQISRYNMIHKVGLIALSNGLQHYYCHINHTTQDYKFLDELPDYQET